MNHVRLLAIGIMSMFVLTTVAQQTGKRAANRENENNLRAAQDESQGGQANGSGVPTVQAQLKLLTEKLVLTGDQQAKTKIILQELHDASQKLTQDKSLSREQLLDHVRSWREKADKKMREFLTDEQKKKLDQVYHEPHPELHGNLHGAGKQAPRAPQN